MGFPKYVFKRGTAKVVENGRIEAVHELVNSEEELKALGPDWCNSPGEAAAGHTKKETEVVEMPTEAKPKKAK